MKNKYIIIAGVNGAGKSTLYESQFQWKHMPRINIDEIARETGSWKDPANMVQAGKTAVKMLN